MKRTVPQFDVKSSPETRNSASAWAWSSMLPNELTPCIEESNIVASDSQLLVRSTPLPFLVRAIPKSPSLTRNDAVSKKLAGLISRWITIEGCRECRYSMARAMSMQNRSEVFWPGFSLGTNLSTEPSGNNSITSVRAGVRAYPKNCTMFGWCSVAIILTSFSNNTLSSAWASANKIFKATGVCLHSAAITMPNEPRPNSTPSFSVSFEIFQSFISRSFIFDGDPPPPLGRFTIVRGVVGRARGLRPRDGGPARRCSAALPGGRLRRAPGLSGRRAGSRRRCGCGFFQCS
mmetsp:Transcript_25832/g.66999  ORF Transcript_25832/g.66999 Transcript_25832/m.66999 type:complete len:290 (-) Transcript_25832:1236-2105(-)